MPTSAEIGTKITTERQEFGKWMNDHKAADGSYDLSGDNLAEFNKRNSALDALQTDLANQQAAEKAVGENETKLAPQGTIAANKGGSPDIEHKDVESGIETKAQLNAEFKSAFEKHRPAIRGYKEGDPPVRFSLDVGLKTIVDLTTSYDTQPTQVGRVLKELDVTWIGARSPQAKGRIERLWRTLQDRLYQELRLGNIRTLAQANAALPALLSRHNARFRQPPATAGSAYRPLPAGTRPADIFCFRYWRTVSKDNVVTLEGRTIPVPPGPHRRSYARARVEVREHLDGSASVHYQGACIARQGPQGADLRTKRRGNIGEKPAPPAPVSNNTPKPARTGPWKPPASHPWRRSLVTAQPT